MNDSEYDCCQTLLVPFQGSIAHNITCRVGGSAAEEQPFTWAVVESDAPPKDRGSVTRVPLERIQVLPPDDVLAYVAARVPSRLGCCTTLKPLYGLFAAELIADSFDVELPPKEPLTQGFVLVRALGRGHRIMIRGDHAPEDVDVLDSTISGPAFLFVPHGAVLEMKKCPKWSGGTFYALFAVVEERKRGAPVPPFHPQLLRTIRKVANETARHHFGVAAPLVHTYTSRPMTADDLVGADALLAGYLAERATRPMACMVVELTDPVDGGLRVTIRNVTEQTTATTTYDVMPNTFGELIEYASGFQTDVPYQVLHGEDDYSLPGLRGLVALFIPQATRILPTAATMTPELTAFVHCHAKQLLEAFAAAAPRDARALRRTISNELQAAHMMLDLALDVPQPAEPRTDSRKRPAEELSKRAMDASAFLSTSDDDDDVDLLDD